MGRKSDGFSLIELMIALVVTLLVSGAVFGLLTAGQSAFKREPQLTERQQSLRQAMSLIQEDIVRAGSGLPGFAQVFTPGLNATGTLAGTLNLGNTDGLEILLAADPTCPQATVECVTLAGTAGLDVAVMVQPAACVQNSLPSLFAFFDATGNNLSIQPVADGAITLGAGGCLNPSRINVGARVPGTPAGGAFPPSGYVPVQVVRYEIAACAAPDAAAPCLYRSVTGTADVTGAVVGVAPGVAGNTTWQVVARGIEDMQVQYRRGFNLGGNNASGQAIQTELQCHVGEVSAWPCFDDPGAVAVCATPCPDPLPYDTLVTQVQVTLVARTMVGGLQGETTNAAAPARVRSQLTGVFTPRTTLAVLSQDPTSPTPRWR